MNAPRTKQIYDYGAEAEIMICPVCGERFEIAACRYWQRKLDGEKIAPSAQVFCSGKCKQKAYRKRRALERNTIQSNTEVSPSEARTN